jgi:hypothetical protein
METATYIGLYDPESKYEAYLEVRETSQTQSPRLLAEEAHDG